MKTTKYFIPVISKGIDAINNPITRFCIENSDVIETTSKTNINVFIHLFTSKFYPIFPSEGIWVNKGRYEINVNFKFEIENNFLNERYIFLKILHILNQYSIKDEIINELIKFIEYKIE